MNRGFFTPALLSIALSGLALGCAATAQFHSKTGRTFPAITEQAVRCDEREVAIVTAAGGEMIGTMSAQGTNVRSTDDDVADKAAIVAARSGGTHVLLTEKGVEAFTVYNPAQRETQCARTEDTENCQTTYTPPSTSTYEKPTGKFIVFRVPVEAWSQLPATLRPVARK